MNCDQAGELLVDLLYEELDAPARQAVLDHLATCRRCTEEYASLRLARTALGRLAAEEPAVKPLTLDMSQVQSPRQEAVIPSERSESRNLAVGTDAAPIPQRGPSASLGVTARHDSRPSRRWIVRIGTLAACAAALVLVTLALLSPDRSLPTAVAKDMPVEIKRTGVSLTILSRPPAWDDYGDQALADQQSPQIFGANQSAFEDTRWSRWPGLALVRDQRVIRHIKPGQAEVRFTGVPAGIWPDSVRLRCLDGRQDLAVLEQNYQFDLATAEAVLAKHVDKPVGLRFKDGKEVKGTLLSFDPATIVIRPAGEGPRSIARRQLADVAFEKLPQGLLTTPTLVWQLANSGHADERQFEVDYLTTGLSWRADYVLKLRPAEIPGPEKESVIPSERSESRNLAVVAQQDPSTSLGVTATKEQSAIRNPQSSIIDHADLVGYATITNASGVTYEDAQLKLMAGDANLLMRPDITHFWLNNPNKLDDISGHNGQQQMLEKSFFEYHLYTLMRPTTIADRETKQLEMVSGRGLAMKRAYVYQPGDNPTAARVVSEMENTEENGLGKPLPKGVVRLYAPDPEGVSTYVGQTTIDHTPVKENLRLPWGHAFDIVCDWQNSVAPWRDGEDVHVTQAYTLRNHKPHDVTVTVLVSVDPSTKAATCELPWHVREVGHVEVPVLVPAGREVKFTFKNTYNRQSGGGLKSPYDK
jgi:hypothetical protein